MQTIGERLEEARKRKGLSIREAADATKILGDYLSKFETNQFNINLPEIYVRGFLRSYASYLGLPAEKIITDYKALGSHGDEKSARGLTRESYGRMELSAQTNAPKDPAAAGDNPPPANLNKNATFRPTIPMKLPVNPATLIRVAVLALAALLIALLLAWGIRALVTTQPAETLITENAPTITLIGIAQTPNIKVTDASGRTTLYDGPLAQGETRQVLRRGNLVIVCDTPETVVIEADGRRLQLKNPTTGQFMKSGTINAPAAQ